MDAIVCFSFSLLRLSSKKNLIKSVSVWFEYLISGKQNQTHIGKSPFPVGVGVSQHLCYSQILQLLVKRLNTVWRKNEAEKTDKAIPLILSPS